MLEIFNYFIRLKERSLILIRRVQHSHLAKKGNKGLTVNTFTYQMIAHATNRTQCQSAFGTSL